MARRLVTHDWTDNMRSLHVGEAFDFPSEHYDTINGIRTRMGRDEGRKFRVVRNRQSDDLHSVVRTA